MGDEEIGQAALLAQVEHQPQELGSDRHVEHRDRLVGDDELGTHDQGTGDVDSLALASGQLVGIAEREVAGGPEPGGVDGGQDLGLAVREPRGEVVDLERLGHEVVDRLLRVERLVGSWKMIWTRRRYSRSRLAPHRSETSLPS